MGCVSREWDHECAYDCPECCKKVWKVKKAELLTRIEELETRVAELEARKPLEYHFHTAPPATYYKYPHIWCNNTSG